MKESSRDIESIEDEELAESEQDLRITKYYSNTDFNGLRRAYCETARGFANAEQVKSWAKLPKAYVEFKDDWLPYSLLSNLEFISRRLLCSSELKGFKVEPFIEDCDDKYIYLSKVNTPSWFEEDSIISDENIEHFFTTIE